MSTITDAMLDRQSARVRRARRLERAETRATNLGTFFTSRRASVSLDLSEPNAADRYLAERHRWSEAAYRRFALARRLHDEQFHVLTECAV